MRRRKKPGNAPPGRGGGSSAGRRRRAPAQHHARPASRGVPRRAQARQKRIEQALRESKERFKALATATFEGISIIERGRFIEVNDRLVAMLGYPRDELVGLKISKVLTPEHLERVLSYIRAGRESHFELPLIRKDGTRIIVEVHGRTIVYRKRRVRVTAIRDVTERNRAEQALTRSNEELERLIGERTARLRELVGELEHFSHTLTHDLRAPLRAIKGFSELVLEMCADTTQPELKAFLVRIMMAAERMDLLITDALNYSRAVRQELPLVPVDVGALLRGMLDSYPEFQPARARIRVEPGLPQVLANEAGMTQCLSNLLGNAVKFVAPGQTPEVRVWSERREDWVRIWVEDRGIGIQPSMLPRVFEMFTRGENTYEGTGMGLALVRKVMDRMGGRVGVESEPGHGSRFWVELKAAEPLRVESTQLSSTKQLPDVSGCDI